MDKPQLLQDIINNHSDASIELIQKLAQEEIDRQIKVSIDGMLYKKPLGILKGVVSYAVKEGKVKEDNTAKYQDGDKSGEASEASSSDSIFDSKPRQAKKEVKKKRK